LKVLVIGSGAREHALAWKFSKSKRIAGLFIAPGNAGTEAVGTNCPDLDPLDFRVVHELCVDRGINLVLVGPEQPLAEGIVDYLGERDIPTVGPPRRAAMLEASKSFSKRFMEKHGIPTAAAQEFSRFREFREAIGGIAGRVVIKKSGLAGGKGVLETSDPEEALSFGKRILSDDSLLLEEFLEGFELSVFALTDGRSYVLLPPCADFKKAGEDDTGLNTGGMGSVCPVPTVDQTLLGRIEHEVVVPTIRGLEAEGLCYRGVLYFGLMITENGPRVLEYNVRFGDPETQVLMPLIDSDFGNLMEAIMSGTLSEFPVRINTRSAVGVVVASQGYPKSYKKGSVAEVPSDLPESRGLIFHAATSKDRQGRVRTGGGRCFTVVGLAHDTYSATRQAYEAIGSVRFDGSWYRRDIARRFYTD